MGSGHNASAQCKLAITLHRGLTMGTVRRTFVARRAYSVVAVIQMVLDGKLPNTGFLKQKDIPLAAFLEAEMGSF